MTQQSACKHTPDPQRAQSYVQVVSQAEAQGRVEVVALSEIQGKHFEEPTIVIAENVGGMEDIPVTCPPKSDMITKWVYCQMVE